MPLSKEKQVQIITGIECKETAIIGFYFPKDKTIMKPSDNQPLPIAVFLTKLLQDYTGITEESITPWLCIKPFAQLWKDYKTSLQFKFKKGDKAAMKIKTNTGAVTNIAIVTIKEILNYREDCGTDGSNIPSHKYKIVTLSGTVYVESEKNLFPIEVIDEWLVAKKILADIKKKFKIEGIFGGQIILKDRVVNF